jgi:mRNA-degrading endonuclease RelE of RelBE toxin-antitoxin system
MATVRRTKSFFQDYHSLPKEIQVRVDKQLGLLLTNPRHPSLRLKRLKGTDRYEIRISRGYRLTFRTIDQVLELRRIGTHDLLRQEG